MKNDEKPKRVARKKKEDKDDSLKKESRKSPDRKKDKEVVNIQKIENVVPSKPNKDTKKRERDDTSSLHSKDDLIWIEPLEPQNFNQKKYFIGDGQTLVIGRNDISVPEKRIRDRKSVV